jgi:predicted DNA-binding transcriptional regulator YafY
VNRTDRLYALVEELRAIAPGSRSASDLARRFEVSSRTVERDLSALQQAGVPIYATSGRRGGYAVDTAFTLPPVNFTAEEATAIALALAGQGRAPLAFAGRAALRKVMAVMRDYDAHAARQLARRIMPVDHHRSSKASVPAVIEAAIVESRVLALDYEDNSGRSSHRAVEPVVLLGVEPDWYLVGWCRLRQDLRTFHLNRVVDAALTDEVTQPRDLDAAPTRMSDFAIEDIFE